MSTDAGWPCGVAARHDAWEAVMPPNVTSARAIRLDQLQPNEIVLGDLNRDRTTDAADAVRYFRAMGIPIHTYAVTDDHHHRGVGLPRRGWDLLVKTISPHCLRERFALPIDPFPPERIPGIKELADACLAVPQQYFRALAEHGFAILIAENLGRLAKTWFGDVDGVSYRLVLWHRESGYTGRISDRIAADGRPEPTHVQGSGADARPDAWAWDPVTRVRFDEGTGEVSFERPATGDRWSGLVDSVDDGRSVGTLLEATVRRGDGSTGSAVMRASYAGGGTFAAGGFGFGGRESCAEDAWTIGQTPPAIIMNPAAARDPYTIAHEMGHLVEHALRRSYWLFGPGDLSTFSRAFSGGNPSVAAGTSPLEGSGYVSAYAASGTEDLAETYATLLTDRGALSRRLVQEREHGSRALAQKVQFVTDRVHVPDPGPAAATSAGKDGRSVVLMTRGQVRMWAAGRVSDTPLGRSYRSPALVADSRGGLRAAVVGTDLRIRHARYLDGHWGRLQELPLSSRVPVALAQAWDGRLVLAVVDRGGFVNVHVLDELSGRRVDSFLMTGLRTDDRVAAAGLGRRLCLVATDEQDRPHALWMEGTLGPGTWEPLPGGDIALRDGATAAVGLDPATGQEAVHVFGIDDRFRIRGQVLHGPGQPGRWATHPVDLLAGSSPAMTRHRTLIAAGLSGAKVYRTRWGTRDPWTAMPAL